MGLLRHGSRRSCGYSQSGSLSARRTQKTKETTPLSSREHQTGPTSGRWSQDRWSSLARATGLSATEPVLLALSGGADSVFLLHVLSQAQPRPRILAVHVDHGLREDESDGDAAFCARLCAKLGVPFARKRIDLEDGPNLEARAREARYRALGDEARDAGLRTVLTGHHEDDALETLLLRWMRGSDLPGLAGLRSRNVLGRGKDVKIQVVRPLLAMRREEVRLLLREAGLTWREDSSNQDDRFTRNRVRGALLPEIEEACGPEGLDGLRAFAGAVERLEEELAGRTAHLAWSLPQQAEPSGDLEDSEVGGRLARDPLEGLASPLRRRALWRLLTEGTGNAPSRAVLTQLEDDLTTGRVTRRSLSGDWTLDLRPNELVLVTPSGARGQAAARSSRPPAGQTEAAPEGGPSAGAASLALPGHLTLPDGRVLSAELVTAKSEDPIPTEPSFVELDADRLPGSLTVRFARPGDRFRPLGAPGSRPLGRFLRDAGIPAEERARIPLVFAGHELVWVAGVRPAETVRVGPGTVRRVRLDLHQHIRG
ncbi:MAG: tRNA lysidine(34) synthetase TilS [Planctomycetota bacterium]|nr:tRNA lysidine(34) synthetase TilS [Planctomycetota bacterium]